MPRRRRCCPVGIPVHVIQRGNNRQVCFTSNEDMAAYAYWLADGAEKFGVDVHAWVLMTNHVHFLMTPRCDNAISKTIQFLGRLYVRYFNRTYGRTGTLFEGRFKTSLVETDTYLLTCQRYIELNPVEAGMVTDPAEYIWSSYRAHAFGVDSRLWTPNPQYLNLGSNGIDRQRHYRSLFQEKLDRTLVDEIRQSISTGLVLGTDRFRNQVEQLTGERQRLLPRGPKRRDTVDT